MSDALQTVAIVAGIMGSLGGIAGLVGWYTARATRDNLRADSAAKLVEASETVLRQIQEASKREADELRRHRETCEDRLRDLELRMKTIDKTNKPETAATRDG